MAQKQITPMPKWNEVTAVFGGRFDPPHLGHREAVRGLLKVPAVKGVIVIPSATPPHKSATASPVQRLAMTRLAFASTIDDPFPKEVNIDDRELMYAKRTGEPNYTFDTLFSLKLEYPKLAFVVGADQFADLHTWYKFPKILEVCHWLVLERKPKGSAIIEKTISELKASNILHKQPDPGLGGEIYRLPGSNTWLKVIPTDAPELSSTHIRQTIEKTGFSPDDSLMPGVIDYLKEQLLYGTRG